MYVYIYTLYMCGCVLVLGEEAVAKAAAEMMELADTDKSGAITLEELQNIMNA